MYLGAGKAHPKHEVTLANPIRAERVSVECSPNEFKHRAEESRHMACEP